MLLAVQAIMNEKRILIEISMNRRILRFRLTVKRITAGLTATVNVMRSISELLEIMLPAVMKHGVPAFSVLAGAGRGFWDGGRAERIAFTDRIFYLKEREIFAKRELLADIFILTCMYLPEW